MLLEFYRHGKLIKRDKDSILGGFSWTNELMYVPSTSIKLPIHFREFLNGHDEIKIKINDKCFWGVIKKVTEDKEDETLTVSLDHIVCEWEYRQISVNNAVKDKNIHFSFKGSETTSDGIISISASDFTILREEIFNMSTEEYILRAGASAWSADGRDVPITVDDSAIEYHDGEYPVVFCAGEGVCVTVKASTKDYVDDVESTYYKMTAHDFILPADGINLSDAEYIALAGVTIELTEKGIQYGMPIPPIQVDRKGVRARDGRYSVKFFAEYIDPEEEDPYKAHKEVSISVACIVEGDNFADPTVTDNIADIYADMNFAHPGWIINYDHGAGDYTIDYVYSRQNKLQALTKTLELTKDLFWRVRFVDSREIDVSTFGDLKQWMFSKKKNTHSTRLIEDPKITHEYDHVVNCVTVYSEKSDTGVSSMTLREIYENPDLQEPGFPVVILRANVNNERDYRMYSEQFPKLAPNNELEYAVIDEESVALESGHLIEASYAFNDLAPFAKTVDEIDENTHELSDDDRIRAAKIAYHAAIRKLKHARRKYSITFPCEQMPAWISVGDQVRLIYDNGMYIVEDCSAYEKMVLSYNDLFIVTKIKYDFGLDGREYNEITFEKEIRVDRDLMLWN